VNEGNSIEPNESNAHEQASTNGELVANADTTQPTENGLLSDGESSDPGDNNSEDTFCEVCMAESWWQMATYQNSLVRQRQQQVAAEGEPKTDNSAASSTDTSFANGAPFSLIDTAATMMFSSREGNDFSMQKLREFYESQKSMGLPLFPDDFDEFWLLVVKARLFNIFKYKGPAVYNRIVLKIRNIVQKVVTQMEERETLEHSASNQTSESQNL